MISLFTLAALVIALVFAGISLVESPRSLSAWALFLIAVVLFLGRVA